jgi:hypothetical protein
MHSPVPAATVHGDSECLQCLEALGLEMTIRGHRRDDGAKGLVLEPLCTQEGLAVEEGENSLHEVVPIAHHQYERGVARTAMVLSDVSATEAELKEIEDLSSLWTLVASELRNELETSPRRGVPLDGDVKRALTVDEAGEVSIQPFLLIVRTDRIVTAHADPPYEGGVTAQASTVGYSEFPANSRI